MNSKSDPPSLGEWQEIERQLSILLSEQKPTRNVVLADIFKAAFKLAQESPGTLNLKIAASVLKELRYSFKMFYPHRFDPKITIFGSARTPPGTPLYQLSKKFAAQAVQRNFMVITGGGPGIMAAGNEGAGEKGFGLNIRLPMEQHANDFAEQYKERLIHYKYFFTRKLFLVKEASAFAFFPGGFGTLDEAFEVLTLVQTGKSNLIPIVLLETKGLGFWKILEKFVTNTLLKKKFVSKTDLSLFKIFTSTSEALDHIELFYRNFHSVRYVKNLLVVRLKRQPTRNLVRDLEKNFASLSKDGTFKLSGALPEEMNEPELSNLHRIVFPFGKQDYGGLRRLVDFLNLSRAYS